MSVPAFRARATPEAASTAHAASRCTVRSATSVRNPIERVRAIWNHRELLVNLVRKDLKVKYKNSVLGFAWSLLNPLLYLTVFYLVFQTILRAGIPNFQIYLLCGVLSWNLFTASVAGATSSITANTPLVTKVWFPRELLPLAAIGAAMVNFAFQALVLGLGIVAFRWKPDLSAIWLLLPATLVVLGLATSLALVLSALNVKFRDTQHLLELGLVTWFWLTPIVYPFMSLAPRLDGHSWVLLLNPMTSVVTTFQRVVYNPAGNNVSQPPILPPEASIWWYARNLAIVMSVVVLAVLAALAFFGSREGEFAETL